METLGLNAENMTALSNYRVIRGTSEITSIRSHRTDRRDPSWSRDMTSTTPFLSPFISHLINNEELGYSVPIGQRDVTGLLDSLGYDPAHLLCYNPRVGGGGGAGRVKAEQARVLGKRRVVVESGGEEKYN